MTAPEGWAAVTGELSQARIPVPRGFEEREDRNGDHWRRNGEFWWRVEDREMVSDRALLEHGYGPTVRDHGPRCSRAPRPVPACLACGDLPPPGFACVVCGARGGVDGCPECPDEGGDAAMIELDGGRS